MHSDTGSNVCLVTDTSLLHNVVEHKGTVNGTGGGKAQVVAYGDLHALFTIANVQYRIIIQKTYVMPSNKHHTLGLTPFKKAGCTRAIHSMHEYLEFHLDNGQIANIPITLINNSLDYVTLKIIPPQSYDANNELNDQVDVIPESNLVRLTEITMNHALTVHEKGLHSSFSSDYQLSKSGQALNMPKFPQLSIDCPICHAYKINKSIPSPGGATKTKQCTIINRNKIPIAQTVQDNTMINKHQSFAKFDLNKLKTILNTEEIIKFKSLLSSRMKIRVPLAADESLCPPGSLIYADFVFYPVESIRGYNSVLDIICLSSRYPFHFLRRGKRPPLDVFQYFITIAKQDGKTIYRVRVDEDGALARSFEFNKLLVENNIQMETTSGYASKLNKIIERPNRDHHIKTRIALGLQEFLRTTFWCFARTYVVYVKRRTWHSSINSTPFYKWYNQPFNYNYIRIFASTGYRYLKEAGKLNKNGSLSIFLGYGSTQTTIYSYDLTLEKWYRSPYFRFDATYSSIPSHSLPLSYRSILGKVQLEDVSVLEMDTSTTPYDPNAGFTVTLPIPAYPVPLNISLKDDKIFNMPILCKLRNRHPWRNHLPTEYLNNVWILAIDNEEPITASGAIDTLNFLRKNHRTTCIIQFHKRQTYSGTLLNDCRSLFDQFERPRQDKIFKSSPSSPAIMNNDTIFTPETNYIVDSATPIPKPQFYTDTLRGPFAQLWKEATFEHYDQNASVSLCSIPFDSKDLSPDTKIYRPVLVPQVKTNDDQKNSYKLKIRMCVNGKEDAKIKALIKYAPTCLGDSLRFTVAVCAFFSLWVSVLDIVNCFQNTMRDLDDEIFMYLPPHYRQWFKLRYPNISLPETAEKLIIRLFNVCQGNIDAGLQWNRLLTKILAQLNIHRSMRDLAVYVGKLDGCMVILNVSTDDILVCTDSPMVRTKIERHMQKYFSITTQHGDKLDYLNYRITQSATHITMDQTQHIMKMTKEYFSKSKIPFKKSDIPFRTDRTVEDDIANALPCSQEEVNKLDSQYGEYSSTYGSYNHVSMSSRPDISYSTARLGYFLTVPCPLGYALLHKGICYLHTHPNKPLMFPKKPKQKERVVRVHWSANKIEDFTFQNDLEAFQDAGHGSEKLLRSSYGMDMHTFMGTVCAWKIYRFMVPINSSDAEMRVLFKSVVRVKTFRLFLISLGCPPTSPTRVYEDNEAVVTSVNSHRITPRLRHIDIPLCYMHNEQSKGVFEVFQVGTRIQMANMGTKPETGPALMRNSSLCMGHVHLKDLPEDQYRILSEPHPISCYGYFRRENK